jgi:phytoene dehydrogenase-like protein
MEQHGSPVVVVGAGLSGLACATALHRSGVPVRVFDASDGVGGRVRTDRIDGFLLDRGFQVLSTAYPEVQHQLDLPSLRLGRFRPGALIQRQGRRLRFLDPARRPSELFRTVASGVMPLADQLRLLALRREVCAGSLERLYERPDESTSAALERRGFGTDAVENFFRPFLAGVFLEPELASSSRFFEFAFRHFATGDAALPEQGMGALALQLAARLPHDCVVTSARVEAIADGGVRVGGETVPASAVVVATDGESARTLVPELPAVTHHPATCLYFAAERDPVGEPVLVLDGERQGPINHLCVPSTVQPSYAPPGRALVSANVVGDPGASDEVLVRRARAQLRAWFGPEVERWRLLRVDRIARALPRQTPGWLDPVERSVRLGPQLFVCGDHRDMASLHGALRTGRRVAEALLEARGAEASDRRGEAA